MTAAPQSLFQYLLTDATVMGAVAWVGFTTTILGLGIAIWQISLVKTAAVAATDAVKHLTGAMRSRERLLDVSATMRLLDSARHNIVQRDYSKAIIFLEFARNECVQIQELAPDNSTQKRQVGGIIVRITRLIEGMTLEEAEGQSDDTAVQRGLEARNILDSMSAILARLRYRYSENGTNQ